MAGRKTFTAGEVLQAADVNDFLMDQSVMVFAGTAARGSAIPSPSEGMVTYRSDDNAVEVYDGSGWTAVGPGQILQVVSTTKTDTFSASIAQGAFSAITGLSATITPSSASSKIAIFVSTNGNIAGSAIISFRIVRDSTPVGVGTSVGSRSAVSNINAGPTGGNVISSTSQNFLDSPATTSAVTYSVEVGQVWTAGTVAVYVNRSSTDSDANSVARPVSTITLMEVAG